jgi:hypothetical protein
MSHQIGDTMSTATVSGQPDPFVAVLDSLSKATSSVDGLEGPIADVQEISSVVDGVLDDLDRLPPLLAGIDEMLAGLRGVLVLLDAVPVVDALAAVCTEAVTTAQELLAEVTESFAEVDESVIKPCKVAFDDLNAGLTEAHDVVHAIGTTIPGYINTVEILHFMAEIAAPLTEILKGSPPAEDLGALLQKLNSLQEQVGEALHPLTGFLDGLTSVVQAINHALGTVFQQMQTTMQTVEQDLQSVEDAFSPVVDAFNAVADAIKPVRWALDAISWIFDAVVQPVLDSFLQNTGLKALLDGLESTIEEKIGIKPILDLVKSNLTAGAAGSWQMQGGTGAAASGRSDWDTLSGVLKQYNTRDSCSLKTDIDLLISALAGTAIDPNKPAVIPDWPDQPAVQVPDPQPTARSVGAAGNTSTLDIPLQQVLRGQQLTRGFLSLAAIPSQSPPTPRPDVPGVLAKTAAPGGPPSLDALKALATQARSDLAATATLGTSLVADLRSYDAARTLPGTFGESMRDLSDLLNDSVQVLDFLEQFGFLTAFIEDLKAPLGAQASAITGILTGCGALAQSGQGMDGMIQQVIQAVPSASVFSAALDYMDAVALGAASLSSAMAQARALDARLNNAHKADLDGLENQLDASAAAVSRQTNEVESLARAAVAAGSTVHTLLQAYAAALGTLSGHASVISLDAVPNLSKGVHLLNIVASILDPLSGLLQKLDCLNGDDPVKAGAAAAINTFRTTATATIDGKDALLRELFGVVLSSALHTDTMSADIAAINALVQRDQPGLDQARQALATALAALPSAMKPTQAFPSTDGQGNVMTVDNLFIDSSFASTAQGVFNAVQQAAKAAGLIPDTA